jgi:hypothetical protein
MNRVEKLLAVIILLFYSNCTDNVAGNSSETNNGVTIIASNNTIEVNGSTIFKAYLFTANYNPINRTTGYCDSTLADSTGTFSFHVGTGHYNVLCIGKDGNQSFADILVSGNNQTDTIYDTLLSTGDCSGKSTIYASTQAAQYYVVIPGSPYKSEIDGSGNFMLSNVAPGQYALSLFSNDLLIPIPTTVETVKIITVKSDTTIQVQW